jgi:SAM-dependent methyltransferase
LFGEEPNAFLASQVQRLGHGRALALADGEGRNSVWLAGQGFDVDAFDFSQPAVNKAKLLAQKRGVEVNFQCADWQSFDWRPQHYDLVAGVFFQFVAPDDRARLFQKMDQALKPGGILVIQGYSKDQLKYNTGGPGKLDHLYDEATLRQAFSGYEVLVSQSYEAILEEGSRHKGTSALVGFVGRKP